MIAAQTNTTTKRPNQLLPLKKKLGDGEEAKAWRKQCLDYFLSKNSIENKRGKYYEYLYKAAQGHLKESDYNYITNPHNQNKKYRYPAKLRNYDIISPVIQMMMGEYSKRTFQPTVTAINSDITTIREQALADMISEQIEQAAINGFNEFAETGFISKDLKGYEELKTKADGIKDEKAIMGQQGLKYIMASQQLKRKFREGFYDFLVTGHVVSKKNVAFDDVEYDIKPPVNFGYYSDNNCTFGEDAECAWVKDRYTLSKILDMFHDKLSDKEIKRLNELGSKSQNSDTVLTMDSESQQFVASMINSNKLKISKDTYTEDDKYEVAYCTWKGKTQLIKVTGTDIFGESYEFETGEGYVKLPGEKLEKTWVNETWHGYRIANEIYIDIEPVEYQRGKMDNPSSCKLLINHRTLFGRHYYTKSPVEKLLPFQEMYNIVKWQAEKTINKNKDKFMTMPKNLIPEDEDMDMFDMLFFADSDQLMFIDELDNKKIAAAQYGLKVIDISLKEYINFLFQVAAIIKEEAEETLGISRQRKGQTFASDLKGVNEQAIYQSAIISEELFLEYEEFIDSDLQGLVDISKYAWRDGKKKYFIDDQKREHFLNILGEQYTETEYSTTVGNGREEGEALEKMKQQAQAMIQNEGRLSTVAKVIRAKNMDKLVDMLEVEEENLMQRQQSQAEAEQQMAEFEKQLAQAKVDIEKYKADIEKYKVDMQLGQSTNEDKGPELSIKQQDLDIKREKNQIEREKIQASLANPVAGER